MCIKRSHNLLTLPLRIIVIMMIIFIDDGGIYSNARELNYPPSPDIAPFALESPF